MPENTPTRPRARDATPEPEPLTDSGAAAPGWCMPCYEAGAFTLAVDPLGIECAIHDTVRRVGDRETGRDSSPGARRPGDSSRPDGPTGPGSRGSRRRRALRTERRDAQRRALTRARAQAHGRLRARRRVDDGRYQPHPGVQNFLPPGRLLDQAAALRTVEQLVAAQPWRSDRREAWLAILRQLVRGLDWDTGLITAVTAVRLGAAGDRATRTVSRVISWAVAAGLVVVAEKAAAPEFLGSVHGRTPTYALYRPAGLPEPTPAEDGPPPAVGDPSATTSTTTKVQVNCSPTQLGVLPSCAAPGKPLIGRRLERATSVPTTWPLYQVPQTPSERTLAAKSLLRRLGLDPPGVSGGVLRHARMLLRVWWDAGACPAGLLWAIDHHPDRPDRHRGDALRGARDPLRVLGHRLRPWLGRLGELPRQYVGHRSDYVTAAAARLEARVAAAQELSAPPLAFTPSASVRTRAALRAELQAHLVRRRQARLDGAALEDRPSTAAGRTNPPASPVEAQPAALPDCRLPQFDVPEFGSRASE